MQQYIFSQLCDICDEFDTYVRDLEPGPVRDHLSDLVQRLDDVTEKTIGLEQAGVYADD